MSEPRQSPSDPEHKAEWFSPALLMLILVSLCVGVVFAGGDHEIPRNRNWVRVAEGEYRVNRQTLDGGIGPFNPALHDFGETWALWRLPDGTFQAEGDRSYQAPLDEHHKDGFSVHLSQKFQVMQVVEAKRLRWRPDSGPLTCEFLPQALECDSGARDPRQNVHLSLPLRAPFGFLWPISAFSMSNITRFAPLTEGATTSVNMLTVDEPGPENPIMISVLEGKLRYIGQEEIMVAKRKWPAQEFELKVPLNPPLMIWTSPQGLLLDLTMEDNAGRLTEHGMRLVRYEEFAEF
jgi:hypothetical protein